MLRTVLLAWILGSFLWGSQIEIAAKILDQTVQGLFKTVPVRVWAQNQKEKEMMPFSSYMQWTDNPKEAQFILIETSKNKPSIEGVIYFGMHYETLKDPQVVGAFYWQKGRPNLLFVRSRLLEARIHLSETFAAYIEELP